MSSHNDSASLYFGLVSNSKYQNESITTTVQLQSLWKDTFDNHDYHSNDTGKVKHFMVHRDLQEQTEDSPPCCRCTVRAGWISTTINRKKSDESLIQVPALGAHAKAIPAPSTPLLTLGNLVILEMFQGIPPKFQLLLQEDVRRCVSYLPVPCGGLTFPRKCQMPKSTYAQGTVLSPFTIQRHLHLISLYTRWKFFEYH